VKGTRLGDEDIELAGATPGRISISKAANIRTSP